MPLKPKMVTFGPGSTADVRPEDFGNKAAVLAKIASLGIPVPPGFSLGVSVCDDYYKNDERLPGYIDELLVRGVTYLERVTGLTFGSERRPLLVSVRSGAPVSMPGIMDTVLNVGLNKDTLRGLIYMTGNPRFAWDTYRRYIENFGEIVLGYDAADFRPALQDVMAAEGVDDEAGLDFYSLKELTERYERIFQHDGDRRFPWKVQDQLKIAAMAVIRSWSSARAKSFRKMNLVRNVRGTAVTVQAMVYGNMGLNSGAGVAFSRNPWTGDKELLVDFKFGAQGEDVVSGNQGAATQRELSAMMPDVYKDLYGVAQKLELFFKDMQDIEFTVQEGRLFILQSRSGKRGPYAALRIATDMAADGLITPREGLARLKDVDLDAIVIQKLLSDEPPLGSGISASGGIAAGRIALTSERAEADGLRIPVILVRETASPDDLPGINAALGLLTARGARTSHAAVIARQLGKVCIVNCPGLSTDVPHHRCRIGSIMLRQGEEITIDGSSGKIYRGVIPASNEKPEGLLEIVRKWREQQAGKTKK